MGGCGWCKCKNCSSCCDPDRYKGYSHRPPPKATNPCDEEYRKCKGTPATLAMGCYWTAQPKIDSLAGVLRSRVGICVGIKSKKSKDGDKLPGPCEVVDFEFDEEMISYSQIIEMFFRLHNPYKPMPRKTCQSAIFYHSEEQKKIAENIIKTLRSEKYGCLAQEIILTKVVPAEKIEISRRKHQHYELQMQDPQVLQAIGLSEMTQEQIEYSHLLCRLNGYLAHKSYVLQQFEEERYELMLKDDQERLIRNMLVLHCGRNSIADSLLADESSVMFDGDSILLLE